jgi:hypothetical protein
MLSTPPPETVQCMNTDIARHFGHLVVRAARNVPCVALNDEVHMVLKSLQLLRQC